MYDIRQFRPTLYLLLLLGFTAFALATTSPEIWVISVGGLLLNAWLVRSRRFRPLPRWLAGLVTTVLFLYTAVNLWDQLQSRAVFILGQFLVFLQLVKLFEVRGNRDYAQLLVLSVLLVVAAAINSASLLFGVVLIAHIFVALYGCLLFHLKLETDQAKALLGLSEENVPPETLRQDQRYLGRSMRRLTVLVSSVSIATAVVVFLLWPRGSGANVFSPLQTRPGQNLTGFGDEVSFQNIARITQNTERVAYVRVSRNNQPVQGTMPLLLRGRTYNVYSGNDPSDGPAWQWRNEAPDPDRDRIPIQLRTEDRRDLRSGGEDRLAETGAEIWRQHITLEQNGSRSLFAMAGPVQITPSRERAIFYHRSDETLELQEPLISQMKYEVVSRNRLDVPASHLRQDRTVLGSLGVDRLGQILGAPPAAGDTPGEARDASNASAQAGRPIRRDARGRVVPASRIDPAIAEYARQGDVSGEDDQGPLAPRRQPDASPSELDLQIARNVETHLRTRFEYTLDLTDVSDMKDRDPIAAFLTDFRRGHCEFFAGAMTLMLQSLGIESRLVTGFRSDEYNTWGEGYYIVRQSHAHAWVEVLGPEGWETFDPTSSRLAEAAAAERTVWQRLSHAFNYLEYMWAESVVAYDRESRSNLINFADLAMTSSAGQASEAMRAVKERLTRPELFYSVSARVMTGLVFLMVGFTLAAIGWFVFERWRLRQRARRIGLDALPKSEQLRLARQLAFYDRLTQSLEQRGVRRPPHQTPLEFSRSVSFLAPDAYDTVGRLTELFYRVRYGGREISPSQQRRLLRAVDALRLGAPGVSNP